MADKNGTSSLSVLGVLLAVGLMAAAFILGVQFKNFRQPGTKEFPVGQRYLAYRCVIARQYLSGRVGQFGRRA